MTSSETSSMSSTKKLSSPPEKYKIWFRHSGQPPVEDDNWKYSDLKQYTAEETKKEVSDHTLTHLVLEGNVPVDIAELAPHVTDMRIKSIRDEKSLDNLCQLTSLQKLDISDNSFHTVPDVVCTLTSLTELDMSKCGLLILPKSLCQLTNLKKLNIGNRKIIWYGGDVHWNQFSTVPDVVCSLTSLTKLDMSNCGLSVLPESLCQLTNLKKLNIGNDEIMRNRDEESTMNQFSTVPDVVCSLTSLTELRMSNYGLPVLPKNLSQLKELNTLDVSHNRLTTLPESLSQLKELNTLNVMRNKLTTLPESLSQLKELNTLYVSWNVLTSLPESISALSNLKKLDISENLLTQLPDHISQLKKLQHLNIRGNKILQTLTVEILNMPLLSHINARECDSLTSPPVEVCIQGATAIKMYYANLQESGEVKVSVATIAVIGQTCSGKTSLIKTLQNTDGIRVLTNRDEDAEYDETTRVFKMEEVVVENDTLQFIDFGGNSIYQSTYQFTLKQNCIPVVVVSMEKYSSLLDEVGGNEAVRQLYFNWLSHLYLAYPKLGPSKLVFTHQDKFTDPNEFEELRESFLDHSKIVFDKIRTKEARKWKAEGAFAQIEHFKNPELFKEMDIYRVGASYSDGFNDLKTCLLGESKKDVKQIPVSWKNVEGALKLLEDGYSTFAEIFQLLSTKLSVTKEQLDVILTYLHNCGKLLWYKDHDELGTYIFYRIPIVTSLLGVLFTHDESVWQRRLSAVSDSSPDEQLQLCKDEFTRLAEQFQSTGIMHSSLLHHLLRTETFFKEDSSIKVAVDMLKSFRLVYIPGLSNNDQLIMPYFCKEFLTTCPTNQEMPLSFQTELQFEGLSLPQNVYHQAAVEMLNTLPDSSKIVVRNNGARVCYDDYVVQLTHDYKSGKVSVKVVTSVKGVPKAWQQLINVTNNSIKYIEQGWKATRMTCTFFCPHCQLKKDFHPERKVNPSWCQFHGRPVTDRPGMQTTRVWTCKKDPNAPVCLTTPCSSLTGEELKTLEDYVSVTRTPNQSVSAKKSAAASQREPDANIDDDGDSDISDVEDFLPGDVDIDMEPAVTTKKRIKQMFDDTTEVYKMSETARGRALVINNRLFGGDPNNIRRGSVKDIENLLPMLRKFHFDVIVKHNLTGEEMLSAIKEETEHCEQRDFGMHVTVIMAHGEEQGVVYGTDGVKVKLIDVYDLLSSTKFVSMSGKPKVIIIQACCAVRDKPAAGVEKTTACSAPAPETNQPTQHHEGVRKAIRVDDLLIFKSCFEGNSAMRDTQFGSPFIRILIKTLYKHACHRDLNTLFEIVQERVRVLSKRLVEKDPQNYIHQTPVINKTLTGYRKIYLFPGFRICEDYDGDEDTDGEDEAASLTDADTDAETLPERVRDTNTNN